LVLLWNELDARGANWLQDVWGVLEGVKSREDALVTEAHLAVRGTLKEEPGKC